MRERVLFVRMCVRVHVRARTCVVCILFKRVRICVYMCVFAKNVYFFQMIV